MKHLLMPLAILVSACGKYEATSEKLGEIRAFRPAVLTETERARVTEICRALTSKVQSLALGPVRNLTYNVQQMACSKDENFPPGTGVSIPVEASTSLTMKRLDTGAPFVFPQMETPTTGLMASLCTNTQDLTNPVKAGNGSVIWFTTTAIDITQCNPASNERCVQFEIGTSEGEGYKLTSKEWVKFQLNPSLPLYGYYTMRRSLSSSSCPENTASRVLATLVP